MISERCTVYHVLGRPLCCSTYIHIFDKAKFGPIVSRELRSLGASSWIPSNKSAFSLRESNLALDAAADASGT